MVSKLADSLTNHQKNDPFDKAVRLQVSEDGSDPLYMCSLYEKNSVLM